jgi:PAP2 superfamily
MRPPATAALLLILLLPPARASAAGGRDEFDAELERAGDTLQVGVPLFALGLTYLLEEALPTGEGGDGLRARAPQGLGAMPGWLGMNGSPRHDLMLAIGRTEMMTYSLKYSVDEQRPNGHGESFPSGHTSAAFAGAEFIRKQYGWWWGLPAYLSAGVVGWSRVEAGKHWTHDVMAGAAIGILSNHDGLSFAMPIGEGHGSLSIAPTLTPYLGIAGTSFAPVDSVRALMEQPPPAFGAGLQFELRF